MKYVVMSYAHDEATCDGVFDTVALAQTYIDQWNKEIGRNSGAWIVPVPYNPTIN